MRAGTMHLAVCLLTMRSKAASPQQEAWSPAFVPRGLAHATQPRQAMASDASCIAYSWLKGSWSGTTFWPVCGCVPLPQGCSRGWRSVLKSSSEYSMRDACTHGGTSCLMKSTVCSMHVASVVSGVCMLQIGVLQTRRKHFSCHLIAVLHIATANMQFKCYMVDCIGLQSLRGALTLWFVGFLICWQTCRRCEVFHVISNL